LSTWPSFRRPESLFLCRAAKTDAVACATPFNDIAHATAILPKLAYRRVPLRDVLRLTDLGIIWANRVSARAVEEAAHRLRPSILARLARSPTHDIDSPGLT
jgi:hypothetical protein